MHRLRQRSGGAAVPPSPAAAAQAAVPRAADDSLAVRAYRSPAGFPLPFRTAVPGSFQPGADPDSRGAAVRFTWAPAGERRDSAFAYVRVVGEGTREGRAREIVRTAAERVRIPGDPRRNRRERQEMKHPRTVLPIDDDRDNVAICSVFLAHFGFHVIVAGDVATGVLLACDSRPAVVITELFARTGTGWSVLEALRAARDGRHPRHRPEHPRAPRRS